MKKNERELSIGKLWLRSLTYGKSHTHVQHTSSTIRYVFVINGSINFEFDAQQNIRAEQHDVVYIPSGTSYISNWQDDTDALCIDIDTIDVLPVSFICMENAGILFRDRNGALIKPINSLEEIDAYNEPYLWMEQVSIIMHILCEIARGYASETSQHNLIRTSVIYMKANLEKDTPVEKLAEMCTFSTSHYRRLFKEYYGMSPVDYRNKLRIEHARQLLATDRNCTIARAAESVGIDDTRYFARLYKKYTGHAPGEDKHKVLPCELSQ